MGIGRFTGSTVQDGVLADEGLDNASCRHNALWEDIDFEKGRGVDRVES